MSHRLSFGQPPPPTRQVLVEKTLDRKVANDRHIFSPGGCFWVTDLNQCSITQFIFRDKASGYIYFSRADKKISNANIFPFIKDVLQQNIDVNCSIYIGGQEVNIYSSYESAEKHLYTHILPLKIGSLMERIITGDMRADKKINAKIFLISLKKKYKRMTRKLKPQ